MIHFKSIICSSLLDKRLEEIFSTDLYQKMSDIYRTKLTLPLFQICWISFDPKLVNIIKLQLISSFSPQTWKQSFSLNLLNLISIALSYTKTDQRRSWVWHCSAPACYRSVPFSCSCYRVAIECAKSGPSVAYQLILVSQWWPLLSSLMSCSGCFVVHY